MTRTFKSVDTGGGCRAWLVGDPNGRHVLVTDVDGEAPSYDSALLAAGLYDGDGDTLGGTPEITGLDIDPHAEDVLAVALALLDGTDHHRHAGAACDFVGGACSVCGVGETACPVCSGVGYHVVGCDEIDR